MAQILLIEPFWSGSHKSWGEELAFFSKHQFEFLTLPGRNWKWRMHGGAISLAKKFLEKLKCGEIKRPDVILCTSLLDLTTFQSLTRKITFDIPFIYYFHENQFSYPQSPNETDQKFGRDQHYGFINLASARAADKVFFNSYFNQDSFLKKGRTFLKSMRDCNELELISEIEAKSEVVPLGMDLEKLEKFEIEKDQNEGPIILWNHRWEFDKRPEIFLGWIERLFNEDLFFQLILLGENIENYKKELDILESNFPRRILHRGMVKNREEYIKFLWRSHICISTSAHEFFGLSILEATHCEAYPILPKNLAYPEHFEEFDHLYEREDEGLEKLREMILRFPLKKQPKNKIKEKDWKNLIHIYDEKIDKMIY